jgi:hypothetical protein
MSVRLVMKTTHTQVVMAPAIGPFESRLGVLIVLVSLAIGLTGSAQAAKTIYKCTKDGHVTLSDMPCDGSTSADNPSAAPQSAASTIQSSSNSSPIGKWTGQEQYHGVENGEALADAHTIVPGTIEFAAGGKVSGSSPENGCSLSGVWSHGTPATIIWIDVTLHGCRYAGLNRRYHGSFLLGKPDSSGELSVHATANPHPGQVKARMFDIQGTLRRN